jgi:GDP-L-fucose synthase
MDKNSKIYIAAHNSMVGSVILNLLKSEGFRNIIVKSSNDLGWKHDISFEDGIDMVLENLSE